MHHHCRCVTPDLHLQRKPNQSFAIKLNPFSIMNRSMRGNPRSCFSLSSRHTYDKHQTEDSLCLDWRLAYQMQRSPWHCTDSWGSTPLGPHDFPSELLGFRGRIRGLVNSSTPSQLQHVATREARWPSGVPSDADQ